VRLVLTGAAVAVVAMVGGRAAEAQDDNSLVESRPADEEEVERSPERIVLVFENPIGDEHLISMSCAESVGNFNPYTAVTDSRRSADRLSLSIDVQEPIPEADCNVGWQVSQPSGEAGLRGEFSFSVEESSAAAAPGTTVVSDAGAGGDDTADAEPAVLAAADVSDGPIWLGRVLSTLGLAVLFGSLVLIVAAWPEGPEYILAVRFLRSVWLLTLAGTVLFVVALSAAVRGESLGGGFNPVDWVDLLDAGWPGRAAFARLVLVVLCGWVVLKPERAIDPTSQMFALGLPALAVATIGLSRTGGELAAVGIVAGVVHALAMAVWLGAVVLLARVVLAGPGEEDLVHAVRGFTRISTPAIVLTVVSGLVQVYRLDGGALFTTGHGRVMLAKAAGVAVMVFVGLTARQVAHARLARASDLEVPIADRLRRAFTTEAAIGAIVLGLSGWLIALAPSKTPATASNEFPVVERVRDADAGLDLTVSLSPGQIGRNQLRVEVDEPRTGLTGLTVTFVPPAGSDAATIVQVIPLNRAGVASTGEDGGIPLVVAGAWRLEVSAATPTGSVSNAGGSFSVADEDGNVPSADVPELTTPPDTVDPLESPPTTAG